MEQLLRFVALTQEFRAVRRKILLAKEDREENDAEHSFQLALVAFYIITSEDLNLDVSLAIKYALVHDLVEVYAGDTPAAVHKGYEEAHRTKHEREEKAARRLKEEFPEFSELHTLIEGYESHKDRESVFVSALDKILPVMNVYLDRGYSWKVHDIDYDILVENKREKIAESPEINRYFDMLVERLKKEEGELFPQRSGDTV